MKDTVSPRLAFRPIDVDAHLDVCVAFAEDIHVCGFGSAAHFHESDGLGAQRYVERLRDRSTNLPGGAVHLWLDDEIIGQILMAPLPSDATIGYISFLYLIPDQRDQGLGILLEAYAWAFLTGLGCQSLRLSATQSNWRAWKFYERGGWLNLGPRADAPDIDQLYKTPRTEAAGIPFVINPDDYLETELSREFTSEHKRQAWQLAYARLERELSRKVRGRHVYVVTGAPGAGRSRWVSDNLGRLGNRAIVFEIPLLTGRHRDALLAIVARHGVPVIAVFVKVSLGLARSSNAQRSADKRLPEGAPDSVYGSLASLEPREGFVWVQTVEHLGRIDPGP